MVFVEPNVPKFVAGASVRDAVHAAVMLNHGVTRIATFDAGFDRIAGLERVPMA